MRVLWFTNTPSLYSKSKSLYNGGGWIESLERIISDNENIELGISFFHDDDLFKISEGNTTYYPISLYNKALKKFKHNLFYSRYDEIEIASYLQVINDFKPDVIHIFGSENSFGLISSLVDVPVIIHIQGILNPSLNAYFPPSYSKLDLIFRYLIHPIKLLHFLRVFSYFEYNAKREIKIFKDCKFYIGRTRWDKNVIPIYSPNARYFYCSEVLKEVFYTSAPWQLKTRDKLFIMSTVSKTFYKGFDLILKAAKLLKEFTNLKFEWIVFGVDEYTEWEKVLGIKCEDVNVYLKGVADSSTIVKSIQESDLFVHPSYIDNSPNSICEAQILGIPVISTNVGGIVSLIEDNKTGYLIPANDPFCLVAKIVELKNNMDSAAEIGTNGRDAALLRHDKETIKDDLNNIYKELYICKN